MTMLTFPAIHAQGIDLQGQTTLGCPNCGATQQVPFYEVLQVPVHSVQLLKSREQALTFTKGDIQLVVCEQCGFITNRAYDPQLQDYSLEYEATQGYSPTFNAFHQRLAESLIERYDLRHKRIIEIGCGQGEFLLLLCALGENNGIGFDPAYDPQRAIPLQNSQLQTSSLQKNQVRFIADYYGEAYTDYQADFVCCKMTLEHIPNTLEFMQTVRRSIGERYDTTVFFQIPNATYVLHDLAFWDIYYEHCSYFTEGSLRYLFAQSGFTVLSTQVAYDNQYLMIEARPVASGQRPARSNHLALVAQTLQDVANFTVQCAEKRAMWEKRLQEYRTTGKRVVIWGGGSKGVAFLTTLHGIDVIAYAVDINPLKTGTFMAGTSHEIVNPAFLANYQPAVVIVMNPVYCAEIQKDLEAMGIHAQMVTV